MARAGGSWSRWAHISLLLSFVSPAENVWLCYKCVQIHFLPVVSSLWSCCRHVWLIWSEPVSLYTSVQFKLLLIINLVFVLWQMESLVCNKDIVHKTACVCLQEHLSANNSPHWRLEWNNTFLSSRLLSDFLSLGQHAVISYIFSHCGKYTNVMRKRLISVCTKAKWHVKIRHLVIK